MDLLHSNLNESCSQILISRLSGMSRTTIRDSNTRFPRRAKCVKFTLNKSWKQWLCATRLGYDLKDDLSFALHLLQLFGSETQRNVIRAYQAFSSNVFTRSLLDAELCQLLGELRGKFSLILEYTQLHQYFNTSAMHETVKREKYAPEMYVIFIC
ncbi:unnamed protein product [Schistosoma mattheei]|uniref:Uncharacterized protein n=1 Tax=Schistosoma mattheei TaxID=31246 RepID=A0A183P4J7_9TREM|nr:unnamed protein product [Schistosoma mattheei]